MKIYKSYSFRDKDPVIDRLRTIMKDEDASYADVHVASGVSLTTLYNWFDGPTQRPSHACVAAVAGALGYSFALVKGSKVIQLHKHRRRAQ